MPAIKAWCVDNEPHCVLATTPIRGTLAVCCPPTAMGTRRNRQKAKQRNGVPQSPIGDSLWGLVSRADQPPMHGCGLMGARRRTDAAYGCKRVESKREGAQHRNDRFGCFPRDA